MAYPRFRRGRMHKMVRVTSGDLSLSSSTWANVSTAGGLSTAALDIVLTAQTSDTIEYGIVGLWQSQAVGATIDVMTLVSSAGVSWFGSGEPTTTTGDGVPGWFTPSGVYMPLSGSTMLTLVAGDISSGTVTLRPRYKGQSGTTKILSASTTTPLLFWAKNLGPVSV